MLKKISSCILLLVLIFSSSSLLFAQNSLWKHFTGLYWISDMTADSNFLWMATESSILQMNLKTQSFKKFTAADGLSFNSNQRAIRISNNGEVYCGGVYAGLNRLRPNLTRWDKNRLFKSDVNGVIGIAFDQNNNMWLSSFYKCKKVSSSGAVTDLGFTSQSKCAVDKNNNAWFGVPSNWVGTVPGGYVLKIDAMGIQTKYDFSNSAVPNSVITNIIVDSSNNVWVATQDSGFVKFDGTNWTRYFTSSGAGKKKYIGLLQNKYVVLSSGSDEKCSHPILYKFENDQFVQIQNAPYAPGNAEYITSIASDVNGVLYIASRTDSLPKLFPLSRLVRYDGQSFQEISLANAREYMPGAFDKLAVDSSNNLWVSPLLGNITKYDGSQWYSWDSAVNDLPAANAASSISVDQQGTVWVSNSDGAVSSSCGGGSYTGGISFYENSKWTTWSVEAKYRMGFSNILIGPNNTKYFLSFYGNNNYSYDGMVWQNFDSIPRHSVVDKIGAFWFTSNDTLVKYHNGTYSYFTIPSYHGISSHVIITPDNSIWFTSDLKLAGTASDSIIVNKFKDGTWQTFKYPLYDLEVLYNIQRNRDPDRKIAVEPSEKVWIGTSGLGVFSCDTKAGEIWKNYNPYNSDIGIIFIGDIVIDKNLNKWFSSANGEFSVIQFNENGIISDVKRDERNMRTIPNEFSLAQNYPNPFNPSTTIRYGIPSSSRVSLKIYNILGQQIEELVNTEQSQGWYEATWDAKVSSGLYFYSIDAVSKSVPGQHFSQSKKMILLK